MGTRPNMTTTEQARKFLFDLSFDNGCNKFNDEKEKPKPTYTQEQLDETKQQAYNEGVTAGKAAEQEAQAKKVADLLTRLDAKIGSVIQEGQAVWQEQLEQMQAVALVIARKILPSYVAQHGVDEIDALVAKVIAEMSREPRLVFRVNEGRFDEMSTRINAMAKQAAYAGKLVILGDPDIGESDCRIEWADGGIERDLRKVWQEIDRIVEAATPNLDLSTNVTSADTQPESPPPVDQPVPVSGEQS